MNASLKIARLFGIPVLLHWSFGLVVVFLLYLGIGKGMALNELAWVSLAVVALFASILFHEFGHALTARRFGVETRDIILLPIGGLARLNKLPEKPVHELIVAIAGPLVNFAIALLLLPWLFFVMAPAVAARGTPTPEEITGDYFYFVPFVFAINIGLAVFNMLPAFPMDGGRVLRALLSPWLGKLQATRIAMIIGQLIAAGMVVSGAASQNYMYIAIAVFIYFAAKREFLWVKIEHALTTRRVGDLAVTSFLRLGLDDTLQHAHNLTQGNAHLHFIVFDGQGQLAGTLSGGLVAELAGQGALAGEVGDFFHPGTAVVSFYDTLMEANDKMQRFGSDLLPVVDNGNFSGVVERDALQKFMDGRSGRVSGYT